MIVNRLEFMPDSLKNLYDCGAISGFVMESTNTSVVVDGFNIEVAHNANFTLQDEIDALHRHFDRLKARMNKALNYLGAKQ